MPRPLVEKYGRNSFSLSPAEMPQPVSATSSSTVSRRVGARATPAALDQRIAHGFGGVVHQIDHHALELLGIDIHRGKVGRQIDAQVDAVQTAGENVQRVADDFVEIAGDGLRGGESRELRELVGQSLHRFHFAGDGRGAFAQDALRFRRSMRRGRADARCARRESAIGVSGFFSSCAMRRATSCQAAAFCARSSSLVSSSTTTNPGAAGGRAGNAETVTARCKTWRGDTRSIWLAARPVRRARFIRYSISVTSSRRKQIGEARGALDLVLAETSRAARD